MTRALINWLLSRIAMRELSCLLLFLRGIVKHEWFMMTVNHLMRYNKICCSHTGLGHCRQGQGGCCWFKEETQKCGSPGVFRNSPLHPSLLPLTPQPWPFDSLLFNHREIWPCLKAILLEVIMRCVPECLCSLLKNILFPYFSLSGHNGCVITDCQDQALLQFNIIKRSATKFNVLFCDKDNLNSSSCVRNTTTLTEHG